MGMVKGEQILMPKQVHIGDTAELHCTFSTDSPSLRKLVEKGTTELPFSVFTTPLDFEEIEILKINVSPAGVNRYQINMVFIPWQTGTVTFPNVKIGNVEVAIKPEKIVSLTEKYGTSSLMESEAPLLLPGTIYKVYGLIISSVVFIILFIVLVIKRKKFLFFIKNQILLAKYRRNKKITIKQLRKLKESNPQTTKDNYIAEQIQHIVRNYLEVRFSYPFTKTVTSELMNIFNEITQMLLPEQKYEAFGNITSYFIRTDYIRYSKDGAFCNNEKDELIENIIENIEVLEASR